ncbi:MAG: VIT1/CCC1 transporter family protein [bacterium]|nr:VIT1/CCC1 transporter family protein [bacterium]
MFGRMTREEIESLFRNFVFGVEDSLVSTVGLLSGIAAAGEPTKTIVLAGVVLIFVEAFSMGVGSLLSDNSVKELDKGGKIPLSRSLSGSITMFVSYFVTGFVPLAPYLFLDRAVAFPVSIIASLIALLFLGMFSARVAHISMLKKGIQMVALGGSAIALGVLVGYVVN